MLDRQKEPEKKHYLITVNVFDNMRLHCYLMCRDDVWLYVAHEQLIEEAEKLNKDFFPVILQTNLRHAADVVRDYLRKNMPNTQNLDNAKDHHIVVWTMPTADPFDETLMALH